uniref:Peptidase_S9 domain-containing protein n=1 Tax=Angiostrongylus cantonensis TaxID=6313 RepID=A0A0K0DG34_ANGCA
VNKKFQYIACVRVPTQSYSRYSILYSHPNASDLSDHVIGVPSLIDVARFYKCDVYAYDYSGYGISSGHASESNQKADIRAIYDGGRTDTGLINSTLIYLFFISQLRPFICSTTVGVILQAPPTSVLRVLLWERACFKKPFSNNTCCADRFSIYDRISDIQVPVLVIHGEDDRKVPIAHGKAVCEKAVNRVAPLWLRATHDNIENCSATWIRIRNFMKQYVYVLDGFPAFKSFNEPLEVNQGHLSTNLFGF